MLLALNAEIVLLSPAGERVVNLRELYRFNGMDHLKIAEHLDKRGYSNQDIEKVMGNNFLRVLSYN